MNHSSREVRNALFSLIREVRKNASLFVRNPGTGFHAQTKAGHGNAAAYPAHDGEQNPFQRTAALFRRQARRRLRTGVRPAIRDGSDVQIPTDPMDAESFFPGSRDQKPFNITKIAELYNLLNHTYADTLIKGKAVANENKLLVEMVKRSEIEEA